MSYARISAAIVGSALVVSACGENKPSSVAASAGGSSIPRDAAAVQEPAASKRGDAAITARSLVDQALAKAQEWQADAQLTVVTTSLADGPATAFWFYDVQSPSNGTCTRIRASANGSVENVGSGDQCVLMKPVSAGFVDSPVAYEAALGAGFKSGDSLQFALRFQRDQALAAPRECWVVWSDADGDEDKGITRGWCVDPATGAFVTRLSGYGRIEPL